MAHDSHSASISGEQMHEWLKDLLPFNRSLTGPGVRQTLSYLKTLLADLRLGSVPAGTNVCDWEVPREWDLREGWIEGPDGRRLVDMSDSNLHVVGYSTSIDKVLTLEELEPHLFSLPKMPEAIPYVTSYYAASWGFCLSQDQRDSLGPGPFRVHIDARFTDGEMNFAELRIPGESDREVLFTTYVCHPSMANNELSGPVVAVALAKWLQTLPRRHYSYRFLFAPETIGALTHLHYNLGHLRANLVAGWVLTCLGDDRSYSYLPSRKGDSLADRASLAAFADLEISPTRYSYMDRGSDERQYCAPGVDLPICSVMRSKYGEYPEYHTSLDNLDLVTPTGLEGGLRLLQACVRAVEGCRTWIATTVGEPHLSKRGLYPTVSTLGTQAEVSAMMNVWTCCDGVTDTLEICQLTGLPLGQVLDILGRFESSALLESSYPWEATQLAETSNVSGAGTATDLGTWDELFAG